MQNIVIKNPRVLSILDELKTLYLKKYYVPQTNSMIGSWEDDPNDWTSAEYRDKIIAMGVDHLGSPENARSYPIKPDHYQGKDPQYHLDFAWIDTKIKTELGVTVNALSQLYPPTGFIGWHNNANAPGFNLIFTWSETGDGWFKYIDKYGEEITMPDTKGWSLKAGYFGSYDDDYTCYHAAYTDCWRMTHSFVVSRDEDYWKDCIDYISGD